MSEPTLFRLKCATCGEANNCGEAVLDGKLACGKCGEPIEPSDYPSVVKAEADRDARRRAEREADKRRKQEQRENLRAARQEAKDAERERQQQAEAEEAEALRAEAERRAAEEHERMTAAAARHRQEARSTRGYKSNIIIMSIIASVFFLIGCGTCVEGLDRRIGGDVLYAIGMLWIIAGLLQCLIVSLVNLRKTIKELTPEE